MSTRSRWPDGRAVALAILHTACALLALLAILSLIALLAVSLDQPNGRPVIVAVCLGMIGIGFWNLYASIRAAFAPSLRAFWRYLAWSGVAAGIMYLTHLWAQRTY